MIKSRNQFLLECSFNINHSLLWKFYTPPVLNVYNPFYRKIFRHGINIQNLPALVYLPTKTVNEWVAYR